VLRENIFPLLFFALQKYDFFQTIGYLFCCFTADITNERRKIAHPKAKFEHYQAMASEACSPVVLKKCLFFAGKSFKL
jgi:hypothetical protein